jgi:hypothetical protein
MDDENLLSFKLYTDIFVVAEVHKKFSVVDTEGTFHARIFPRFLSSKFEMASAFSYKLYS